MEVLSGSNHHHSGIHVQLEMKESSQGTIIDRTAEAFTVASLIAPLINRIPAKKSILRNRDFQGSHD
jgi:hypothetical protein